MAQAPDLSGAVFRGFDPRRRRKRRTSLLGASILLAMAVLVSGTAAPVRTGLGQAALLFVLLAVGALATVDALRPEPVFSSSGLRVPGTEDGRLRFLRSHWIPLEQIQAVAFERHGAWVRFHVRSAHFRHQADFWDPRGAVLAALSEAVAANGIFMEEKGEGP